MRKLSVDVGLIVGPHVCELINSIDSQLCGCLFSASLKVNSLSAYLMSVLFQSVILHVFVLQLNNNNNDTRAGFSKGMLLKGIMSSSQANFT